ncbi:MAG: ribonuclease HII [Pseudomonadota bacterium]
MHTSQSERGAMRVAGTDEAGRGPLAGNVVAAAVVLDPQTPIAGLNDSKKLSPKRREALFEQICESALAWHISEASVDEIDRLNILHASMLAMQRAVAGLRPQPGLVLVDGNRTPDLPVPARAVIGGDATEPAIAAASILAKVARDRQMRALHAQYPQYGFADHKGYPTAAHREALKRHGPCAEHRRSFAPVKAVIDATLAVY